MTRRAIIAGRGALPKLLAEASRDERPIIVDFQTTELPWTDEYEVIIAEFEKAGRLFENLRTAGVGEVVFGGGMERPKLNPLRMDRAFLKKAPTLLKALRGGDDRLLRLIAGWFEEEGFKVLSAQDVMTDLLAPAGIWGRHAPSEQDDLDIDRGVQILEALSAQDVAQACVIGSGLCFGIETIQGTDALLSMVDQTPAHLNPPHTADHGVLVKLPKVCQEMRVDLPSIGVDTIKHAKSAGLNGVAVKEGGALVLGFSEVVAAADEAGLFVMGLPDVDTA